MVKLTSPDNLAKNVIYGEPDCWGCKLSVRSPHTYITKKPKHIFHQPQVIWYPHKDNCNPNPIKSVEPTQSAYHLLFCFCAPPHPIEFHLSSASTPEFRKVHVSARWVHVSFTNRKTSVINWRVAFTCAWWLWRRDADVVETASRAAASRRHLREHVTCHRLPKMKRHTVYYQ